MLGIMTLIIIIGIYLAFREEAEAPAKTEGDTSMIERYKPAFI